MSSLYFSNKTFFYLLAIISGIFAGISSFEFLQNFGVFTADIFIKAFKCISLPIIALSIIVTMSQYTGDAQMKSVWKRTLFYTISTTILAASIACVLYYIIAPANITNALIEPITNTQFTSEENYFAYVAKLIPDTIFTPFLEHQVMGALFMSMVVGIAIRYIPDQNAKAAITNVFKGAHGILFVITGWIVKVIPLALFGFITTSIVQIKSGGLDLSGLGKYLLIIVLANLIQGFVILPIFLAFNKIKPFKMLKGMLPALSIAFFSKSSVGSLPVTMETIEKNAGVSPKISRFILPLCTSINMNGCAAFIFTTVIFLMQNHGLEITASTMVLWVVISTIAAIGNAGVPMGCFFLSASLLVSMNVPITLLGLILPFYSLIDMLETSLNVWSDSCVAKMVDKPVTEIEVAKNPVLVEQ